jgi:hypothetical protein
VFDDHRALIEAEARASLDVDALARALWSQQHASDWHAYDKWVPPNSANRAEHERRATESIVLYLAILAEADR